MARVESITGLEHMAARHWRGTEEDRLGGWLTRPGPAFVMVADLATVPPAGNSPAGGEFRVDAEPDDPWLATYHCRAQDRQPPVLRIVLMSAPARAFASIRGDAGEVLAIGRLSIADGWAGSRPSR